MAELTMLFYVGWFVVWCVLASLVIYMGTLWFDQTKYVNRVPHLAFMVAAILGAFLGPILMTIGIVYK